MAHFPCTGQQYRAEHFWAAISKVDESGWVQFLQKELVPGAPSEIGIWHKVRLVVEGPEFRLWVNGRAAAGGQGRHLRRTGLRGTGEL